MTSADSYDASGAVSSGGAVSGDTGSDYEGRAAAMFADLAQALEAERSRLAQARRDSTESAARGELPSSLAGALAQLLDCLDGQLGELASDARQQKDQMERAGAGDVAQPWQSGSPDPVIGPSVGGAGPGDGSGDLMRTQSARPRTRAGTRRHPTGEPR